MTRADVVPDPAPALGANPPLQHPGPSSPVRRDVVATRTRPLVVDVEPGDVLREAAAAAVAAAGAEGGFVALDGLVCEPLRYVIPAASDDGVRVAWYSATHQPAGPCVVRDGHLNVGRDDGRPFAHAHGTWVAPDGTTAVGHLRDDETVVAERARLTGHVMLDATLRRRDDHETAFPLFRAEPSAATPGAPDALLVTLRPGEDVATALAAVCRDHGITHARVHGLGSMNGAWFRDGGRMRASVSEFLVRRGTITPNDVAVDIAAVDAGGNQFCGELVPGRGMVAITAELVVVVEGA